VKAPSLITESEGAEEFTLYFIKTQKMKKVIDYKKESGHYIIHEKYHIYA
jgi:hypothetical protein